MVRRRGLIVFVWLAAVILAGTPASAQNAFLEHWKDLVGRQPDGVTFTITTPKTDFYFGEVIPLDLSFTSTQPRTFLADSRLYDRVGRMNYTEEFIAAPASLSEDPIHGLWAASGGMGGLSGGPVILSGKPFAFERVLNEWVRFREPGEYRLYVVSRRVSQVEAGAQSDDALRLYGRGKAVELVSNILTLTIRPAPAAWVNAQIAAAKKTLEAPPAPDRKADEERLQALRVLRFLDSLEAAQELVRLLPAGLDVNSYSAHLGVLSSPYRKQLLPLMEERLVAADQPVSEPYLRTLMQLAELVASGGLMPPFPGDATAQNADVQRRKANEYADRLIASLPGKQPEARKVSLTTLLNFGMQSPPEPPWLGTVAASVVADFRSLPVMTQFTLLQSRWSALKGTAILPVLRDLVARPPRPQNGLQIQSLALRRLYELSPAEGRKIVLDEIRQPTRSLTFAALAMLPDHALPELNEALVEQYNAPLILRYATGDIVKRVEEIYLARRTDLQNRDSSTCAGPLAFYFLKYDPPFGERVLREALDNAAAAPACNDMGAQFREYGPWAYSPALEKLAIEYLTSPNYRVKRGAAEVLGMYGTAAAEKPLWDAMEYFRSWWTGRETELKSQSGEASMQLEGTLRIALAQADGWVLGGPELRRLLALCSSDWCRQDVTGWIGSANMPVKIEIRPQFDEFRYTVGQYGPNGDEWLRRKLLQYPEATVFRIERWQNEEQFPGMREARERVESMLRESGRKLAQ